MKKNKQANQKNSLEQLLLRWKADFEQNKTKTYQFLLVFVLVVAAVWVVRMNLGGSSRQLNGVDSVYAAATQGYCASGDYAPDGKMLSDAAASYKKGAIRAELNVEAGESYLKAGAADVTRKKANSKADKNDATVAALVPADNFNAAVASFEAALAKGPADLKARAAYGAGVAKESLASVAADDAAVDAALAEAKAFYQKVAEFDPNSPYCEPAAKRLASLERALTVDYYKTIATEFKNLPIPTETPSILSGDQELKPGETQKTDDFSLNDDSDEAAPAADAVPAEAPASEAPAADAVPAETPASEAPAADAVPAETPASEAPAADATPAE